MSRVLPLFAAALIAAMAAGPARADDATDLIARFSGEWLGTGQLLFGRQSGLQFHCALTGDSRSRLGFGMTGRCWMGMLSAPVYAAIHYNAETDRFYGEFMDGADGDGVDIVAARQRNGISMRLTRGSARGRLTAEAVNADQFKAMLFYHDRRHGRDVPVVAMGFARKGAVETLPDYLPPAARGAMASSN